MTRAPALWIVPPHRDATLVAKAPPGDRVLDLQGAFVERQVSPTALAALSATVRDALLAPAEAGPERVGEIRRLLELEAARGVLARPGLSAASGLRAQGLALSAATAHDPLRLRLDDLELASGTTERSADLAGLGPQPAPFGPELDQALEAAGAGSDVRIVLDCDQRLPFVFALLPQWKAETGRWPTLGGAFAVRHAAALERAFPGVTVSAGCPAFELRGAPAPTAWRWDGAPVPDDSRWAGYLPLARLEEEAQSCELAVVTFAALEEERILGVEGEWMPRAALAALAARIPVALEWQFGAPGVELAAAERTCALLSGGGAGTPVAGLRRFHWPIERPAANLGGLPVTLAEADPTRDLVRSRALLSPAVAPEEALTALVRRTLQTLNASSTPPSPGRVAGGLAAVAQRRVAPAATDRLQLGSDVALVDLPLSLDGRPQRTVVAFNLRTGTMLNLDPRLLPALTRLTVATPPAEALAQVPAAQREKLVGALRDRQILEGAHP